MKAIEPACGNELESASCSQVQGQPWWSFSGVTWVKQKVEEDYLEIFLILCK